MWAIHVVMVNFVMITYAYTNYDVKPVMVFC